MAAAALSIPLFEAALFLDLDGTLAPIAERPELVRPDRERNALLKKLVRALDGRLAVVSGRQIDDVDRILQSSVMCVAGVHGLERRDAKGELHIGKPHAQLERVYIALDMFARKHPELLLEFKALSVALHYRQAPHLGHQVLELARRLAWDTGMKLQEGRMVVELRSPGADKGVTVDSYMAEAPFLGASPVFIGDDVTDEDGFAAAKTLGGVGVLVGRLKDTAASACIEDPRAVLVWLAHCLDDGVFEFSGK